MNFYTSSAKMLRNIDKKVAQHLELCKQCEIEPDPNLREATTRLETSFDERVMRLAIQRMIRFKEIAAEEGLLPATVRTWFITIRPDTTLISFDAFYDTVHKFVHRKCFVTYSLSFEQKGITTNTLGQGFHVHLIAHMKQRSKTEVLRDTQSTFKHCTAANCIDVQVCKNPDETKQHYLIDYDSNDGHKIITKEWDELWRQQEGLLPIYENNLDARVIPVALSSPTRLLEFS